MSGSRRDAWFYTLQDHALNLPSLWIL